jgi:hypothetical protein
MLLAARPELFVCEAIALDGVTGDGTEAGALSRRSSGATAEVAMGVEAEAALALLAGGLRGAVGG